MCPGTTDFNVAAEGKLAFEQTGSVEVIGFVSCGGCPGKRAIPRAKLMVNRGAEMIVIASCISKGNPIGFPCPHYATIRDCISGKVGKTSRYLNTRIEAGMETRSFRNGERETTVDGLHRWARQAAAHGGILLFQVMAFDDTKRGYRLLCQATFMAGSRS